MGKIRPSHEEIASALDGDELQSILAIGMRGLAKSARKGPPVLFPHTPEGLDAFRRESYAYLQYVQEVDSTAQEGGRLRLIPDVESWAAYMGITRETIRRYEATRGEEWAQAIQQIKGVITACKKQLALQGKIPPVLAIFDLTNNHGYVNSSEFRLQTQTKLEARQITAEEWEAALDAAPELPQLEDRSGTESSDDS